MRDNGGQEDGLEHSRDKQALGSVSENDIRDTLPDELARDLAAVTFPAGTVLSGRFEIVSSEGFGGTGAVYRVQDRLLNNRICALKALYPSLVNKDDDRDRFTELARSLISLRHERIASVFDIGEDTDKALLFLVSELLDGRDLASYLDDHGQQLHYCAARSIILRASEGLAYAHTKGLVHWGLQPRNIFLLGDGSVKILDFGITGLLSPARLTLTGMSLGTHYYMAPEQLMARHGDVRTDIFSTGVVFYRMMTGRMPVAGFQLPGDLCKSCPGEVNDIISKCLSQKYENRYSDIGLFIDAVAGCTDRSAGIQRSDDTVVLSSLQGEEDKAAEDEKDTGQNVSRVLFPALIFVLIMALGVYIERSFRGATSDLAPAEERSVDSGPAGPARDKAVRRDGEHDVTAEAVERRAVPVPDPGPPVSLREETIRENAETAVTTEVAAPEAGDVTALKIDSLLSRARALFQRQQFTSPPGDNVYDIVQKIFLEQPANPRALQMVQEMRDWYIDRGDAAFRADDFFIAATYYEKARYVDPDYLPAASKLRETNTKLSDSSYQRPAQPAERSLPPSSERIVILLKKAKSHMRELRLTSPVGRNAHSALREILALDPENREALRMAGEIRDRYLRWGNEAFNKANYLIAATYYEKALYVDPVSREARRKIERVNALLPR